MRPLRWLALLGSWMLLAGCVASVHQTKPSEPLGSSAPTRSEIHTAMMDGLARAYRFEDERLPQLHQQIQASLAVLGDPASSAAQRHQAQVDLREADYQANQITLDTGLQINAIQAAAEPWLAQCSTPPLKNASGCMTFVADYDRWNEERGRLWKQLTGPVLRWRDELNAAIARHPHDPVVQIDYRRGAPRCVVHDMLHPPVATTGL